MLFMFKSARKISRTALVTNKPRNIYICLIGVLGIECNSTVGPDTGSLGKDKSIRSPLNINTIIF